MNRRTRYPLILLLALALLAAVSAAAPVDAQQAADAAEGEGTNEPTDSGGPELVVDELIADLGSVANGEIVTYEFVVRNEGDAPLEITEARPSCGCTVADYDKVIPPGGSGKVAIEVDTSSLAGPASNGLTLFTNDPANPRVQLTYKVMVLQYLVFNPGIARFTKGKGHPPGEITQILYAPDYDELKIEEVTSPWPYLDIVTRPATEDERRPDGQGEQYVLEMTLDYAVAPVGPLLGEVEVITNHPKQKKISLSVSGFVRPLVAVTPSIADFGEVVQPTNARLLISNFGPDELAITKVEPNLQGASVEVKPIREGRSYNLQLTLTPEEMAEGPFSVALEIYIDSQVEPVVTVPLRGSVPKS